MTKFELKKLLVHRITEINDISFLRAIKTILDSKTDNEVLMLNEDQRKEIMLSKKEIQNGFYTDHEVLEQQVIKWASKK